MKITGIIIPADVEAPLHRVEFDQGDIPAMERLTGGPFTVLQVARPYASVWMHEAGQMLNLPLNQRGTLFLWLHASHMRTVHYIAGDLLVTGQVDGEGNTQSVPDELVTLLFETERYRVDVQLIEGNGEWNTNDAYFDKWEDAYSYALRLAADWGMVLHVRAVPA